MRARLPDAMSTPGQRDIKVDCYAGTLTIPRESVDGQAWVAGRPDDVLIGPPVRLTAGNLHGVLVNLDLAIYWTPWIRDPAGRAMVDAAVDRVLALGRGWQRSEN